MAKCVWCEEEYDECELTWTKLGHLCDTCIRAIESRGESVNDDEPECASDVREADEEWEKLRDIVEDGDVDEICDACRAFIKLHKADPVKFIQE